MTIKLSSLGGSRPLGFVGMQSGEYLRLTYLLTNTGTEEAGVTLTVDGTDVFTNWSLADAAPSTASILTVFGVSSGYGNTSPANGMLILREIECKTFTLTKVSGSTAQAINYVCETLGEIE
mgnify:CR=1 FL=1